MRIKRTRRTRKMKSLRSSSLMRKVAWLTPSFYFLLSRPIEGEERLVVLRMLSSLRIEVATLNL